MEELDATLDLPGREGTDRWAGADASARDRLAWTDHMPDVEKLVIATSGTGSSAAFAIAEEIVDGLCGSAPHEPCPSRRLRLGGHVDRP